MGFDVFISYPHQDKAVADAACAKLEAEGIRCWIAPRDIAPSAEWAGAIVDAIDQCRAMVLIFSSSANGSKQVHREVQQAFDGEKPVVPFRIENVVPESSLRYYMDSVHWLDALTPPLEQHLNRLTESVRRLLSGAGAEFDINVQRQSKWGDEKPLKPHRSGRDVPTRLSGHGFVGAYLLINSGLGLAFQCAAGIFGNVSLNGGEIEIFLILAAPIIVGVGTIKGMPWARYAGFPLCAIGTVLSALMMYVVPRLPYVPEIERTISNVYFGALIPGLGVCTLFYSLGWKAYLVSSPRVALSAFVIFTLLIVASTVPPLFYSPSWQINPTGPDTFYLLFAIFFTILLIISTYCIVEFRRRL